jgi:hypothetical protein
MVIRGDELQGTPKKTSNVSSNYASDVCKYLASHTSDTPWTYQKWDNCGIITISLSGLPSIHDIMYLEVQST